jgi:hypothetical protein
MTKSTKKTIFTLIGILLLNLSFGQNNAKYSELTKNALILYENKEYLQAGQKYSEAFNSLGNSGWLNDRYIAACSWALANETDSAFSQLFKVVKGSNFIFEDYVINNSDLNILHSDKRWSKVIEIINNKDNYDIISDKQLGDTLKAIYFQNVKYRQQVTEIRNKYGVQSDTVKAYWKKIEENDSKILTFVKKVLDTRGWLGSDIIGVLGNQTLFLAIQHSDLATQEKYLPMMKEAVQKGNASPSNFAYLADRLAIRHGKKQSYGSQYDRDQVTGEYYILPLEDPDNVDIRRKEVGLGKLQDNVSHLGMTWNIEEYKKKLPEIEAKQKK